MGNPIISIIVPVYNSERYLKQCVNSILNQTFKDFELILIDDGSTDSSRIICDEYLEKDKRVVVRHKENGGICSARNLGLDIARGDYIGFCDNDDLINRNMYEILYNTMLNGKYELVICNCTTYYTSGFEEITKCNYEYKEVSKYELYKNIYGTSDIDYKYMPIWNKLFKRSLFVNIRFDDEGLEDLYLNNIIYNKVNKVAFISENLYYWRRHIDSESHKTFNKRTVLSLETYLNNYNYLIINSEKEYAEMCLHKWFKVLLNSKYNSKKSNFEEEVKELTKNQFKKYYGDFVKAKDIKLRDKIIFSLFNYIPVTYSVYRWILEKWSIRRLEVCNQ